MSERITAVYRVKASGDVREIAEDICIEQTAEA